MNKGLITVTEGMWHRTKRIRNASYIILFLEIVILILVLLLMSYAIVSSNNAADMQNKICLNTQSLACTDFNPCTADFITPVSCNGFDNELEGCIQYKCVHVPVSNGSCCDQQDYCFLPNPNKACVYGTCLSPEPTECRGWCNTTEEGSANDCPDIPLTPTSNGAAITTCTFNSCTYIVIISFVIISDPLSMIDTQTGNLTNLNISHCLVGYCTWDDVNQFSVCTYNWACAPYTPLVPEPPTPAPTEAPTEAPTPEPTPEPPGKKRNGDESYLYVSSNWTKIMYPRPHYMPYQLYRIYNDEMNYLAMQAVNKKLLEIEEKNTPSPTDDPTSEIGLTTKTLKSSV